MSQENVEIVGMACDAWMRGDLDAVLDVLFHEDLEWDTTHFQGWLESRVIRGRTEVRNFLVDDWLAPWDAYVAGIDALVDAGEDEVLAFWWQRMSGRGSGVPVHLDSAQIWTLRNGQVLRIANYTDLVQALEAAGLSE
jgi:ketosteroid isomerase-like protein